MIDEDERACRYTVGKIETDIRHITKRLRAEGPVGESPYGADRDIAELAALHNLVVVIDMMIDRHITLARRREHRSSIGGFVAGRPMSWNTIGAALGISGKAAAGRARTHHLAVKQLNDKSYAALVDAGRAAGDSPGYPD
ncbi:hypothetical protein [Mycobacteroides abscessus]|uniref:hypothetical protein n=1 Tax=Mycobacteroides abscessus TaxID=36809 RepID=UPI00092BAB68|nr:hypothetical protein [Mycobacteroides abscessus]SHY28185.1 Uncharacterised protein [Mycobacteroides abscessus subsp. abscessus]SID71904.1 Uncharacterised protein [Mycobacteroides abscessus subsp. abscessus]SIK18715.1 Uncharacterised protein [Mycobacteroides abscessus subsp. abscessus]SIM43108.1 Uncharacterised protein [Mycobacteroides abscessus subsp. abscessus]SKL79622.1 Uncharacterised protein [Mycobacteroides abscessus subsp. massiliense]